ETHSENPVGEAPLDLLWIDGVGGRGRTRKGTVHPLDATIAVLVIALFELTLASERQHTLLDVDADVLDLQPWELRLDDEGVLVLEHVDCGCEPVRMGWGSERFIRKTGKCCVREARKTGERIP